MVQARYGHAATVLADGKVLATGGFDELDEPLNSTEAYDPNLGTWSNVSRPPMKVERAWHTAVRLTTGPNGGKVLVAGGQNLSAQALRSIELYDPAINSWTLIDNCAVVGRCLVTGRYAHTAVLLADGRVMVTGGFDENDEPLVSMEFYDPTTGAWTKPAVQMQVARAWSTAVRLADGRVMVVGGEDIDGLPLRSAEIYNPSNNTWESPIANALLSDREGLTAVLRADGKVLVAGGSDGDVIFDSGELYNPASQSSTATLIAGAVTRPREWHTAVMLGNGKVLLMGGLDDSGVLNTSDLYTP